MPWLCGYQDWALFVDNDMVCHADVSQIFNNLLDHKYGYKSLYVVKHDYQAVAGTKMYGATQTVYPRKNWSSVMLMNCAKLRCWTKDVVEEANGARLHRFQDLPDDEIGDLDPAWNRLESQEGEAFIRHWTEGGPWYPAYRNCPHAAEWYTAAAAAGESV